MESKAQVRKDKQTDKNLATAAIVVVGIMVVFLVYSIIQTLPPKVTELPGVDPNIEIIKTASGLQYQDLVVGSGAIAQSGQTVTVDYKGWTTDGATFDSSIQRGQPFEFVLGTGAVIEGWDEGVVGMAVGGKRLLIIPSDLGYGDAGAGGVIPGGATILFEVDLLEIK